jgi:hypothetical protein
MIARCSSTQSYIHGAIMPRVHLTGSHSGGVMYYSTYCNLGTYLHIKIGTCRAVTIMDFESGLAA